MTLKIFQHFKISHNYYRISVTNGDIKFPLITNTVQNNEANDKQIMFHTAVNCPCEQTIEKTGNIHL